MDSEKIEEFFREFYEKEILAAAKMGKKSITVDYDAFDRHCRLIAEKLLNDPETMLPEIEKAASDAIVLPEVEGVADFRVRFKNLPEHQMIRIRSLRSEHIGKFVCVDGIVKRAGEVKPKIDVAEFECECGNKMSVKQTEELLRYPSGCDMCGNKRGFKMIDKKLFDSRWVVIEEPFEMTSGEKPGQVSIYLKEDLTSPELQRKCDPGNRIKVTGIIKEMTLKTKGGARKVQSDIFVEANYVEPAEIEWEEVEISNKDVEAIKALASDPNVYKRIVASIAPSIYGLEEVKEAILLQMMGGVQQKLLDGTRVRGDIHILLLGDPAVAKCVDGDTEVLLSNGQLSKIKDIAEEELKKNEKLIDDGSYAVMNHDILSMNEKGKIEGKIANIVWKRSAPEYMYYLKTQTGREITVTPTHPFFVCNGLINSKKADDVKVGDFVAVPRILEIKHSDNIDIKIEKSKANNANHINIPKKVTPELSRVLGYIIGDGYVQKTKTGFCVWFTNNNRNLIEDFASSVRKVFGLECTVRKPHKGKTAFDAYASSVEFGYFLKVLDSNILHDSEGKRVPQAIMRASDENVREFIKAYFDCEATFSSKQTQICCTSASKQLLKDVQLLLLRFGIISQIGHTISGCNGWKKKYFRLKVTGSESIKNFIDNIGFREKSAKFSFKKLHSNIDVIPSVSRLLKSVRIRNGLSQFEMGIPRTTYQHYERGERNPSRRDLEKIVENIKSRLKSDEELSALDFLAHSDIFWDKIIEKEKVKPKEKWVYDLQVDGTHNFVANGIFVHNSQLLKMVSQLIPRGRYVSGKGATGAGLTATVFRDEELMGGWVLEAGAMVLCHKGVIAIDEFDKMSKDDQIAMHEALEQQTISIAKASIIATLPAQVSVLAGANPKFSRFDVYRPIAEQTDIPDTLLSRFDLKFALRDIPDKDRDEKIASHILESRLNPELRKPEISQDFMRKFIAYMRQNCHPRMTKEALERIKNFYVTMRGMYKGEDTVAITLRQNEALLRLAEASAKVRFSPVAEEQDAERAIRIMKVSLQQLGYDYETGRIDIDRTEGTSSSQRSKIRILLDVIEALEKRIGKQIPKEDIIAEAEDHGLKGVDDMIQKLKSEGMLFEPKHNVIQKL